jgi:hypothetical protein
VFNLGSVIARSFAGGLIARARFPRPAAGDGSQ